jgi:hypothetical protein
MRLRSCCRCVRVNQPAAPWNRCVRAGLVAVLPRGVRAVCWLGRTSVAVAAVDVLSTALHRSCCSDTPRAASLHCSVAAPGVTRERCA